MINSVLPRVAPTVQKSTTTPEAAPAPAPAPTASPYFKDTLEQARPSRVNLTGESTSSAAVAASVKPAPLDSGGTSTEGPKLLHLDTGWTPQGQGYDAGRKEVLTTYYDDCRGVMLSVQDKDSGKETQQVKLGGLSPDHLAGAPSHGGGVSTDGEFVYVSDTKHLYVYSREAIEQAAKDGTEVPALQVTEVPQPEDLKDPATGIGLVSAGSYMTVKDGYAYVGAYSKDGDGKAGAVWRYKLDEDTGAIIKGSRQGPIRAPDRAQGMMVVDGALLFTTGDRKLVYQPFDSSGGSFEADISQRKDISNGQIDPYAQGFNVVGNELWVTYESGSHKYRDKLDSDFEPRESIQRIPLESLDLDEAGITPEHLQS
ncbi:hypothetical protein NVS55_28635 [Myxococcus stipitatus]|uniref:hypothetical protein n=1 Tax=Myxococcus stipitatus TaxID=83455 RepID=UPI003144EA9F